MGNEEKKVGNRWSNICLTVRECNFSANVTKSIRVVFTFPHYGLRQILTPENLFILILSNIHFFNRLCCGFHYSLLDKKWICKKTRPDTAKPLAFLKPPAKTTSETFNSLQTSKISQTSVIFTLSQCNTPIALLNVNSAH